MFHVLRFMQKKKRPTVACGLSCCMIKRALSVDENQDVIQEMLLLMIITDDHSHQGMF